jgi:hypothetical protein
MERVEITICVDVHDPAALLAAAVASYTESNGGEGCEPDPGDAIRSDRGYQVFEILAGVQVPGCAMNEIYGVRPYSYAAWTASVTTVPGAADEQGGGEQR